jgi:hypothetical protein
MRVLVCLFRTCFLPLGIGSHLSPDGGGFSLSQSTAWQRMATVGSGSGSHLSPDGGGIFPSDVHRLAADGYGR